MQLIDLLSPERVMVSVDSSSKKKLLETLSLTLADDLGISSKKVYQSLYDREKLGSTGLGFGVAIPHGRLQEAGCTMTAAMAVLQNPVDFDALDKEPVDIVFAVVVPEDASDMHLDFLRQVALAFEDEAFREQIRHAPDANHLYQVLVERKTETAH